MSEDQNVARGHKANLSNPNTSEESKEHSREVLQQMSESNDSGKNPGNVAGGLKAAINNPNVSEEAKENAKERLEEMK